MVTVHQEGRLGVIKPKGKEEKPDHPVRHGLRSKPTKGDKAGDLSSFGIMKDALKKAGLDESTQVD